MLFAGGGTGGHIYPNVGILEALRARRPDAAVRFLVSNRPGDAKIMDRLGEDWTASPVRPLPTLRRPWEALPFLRAWRRGTAQVRRLVQEHDIRAVVATGGFVSGPAIAAAASSGLPRAMVNLDGVPGQANRLLVRRCSRVFTAYRSPLLPSAEVIGLPLRRASVGERDPAAARRALDLPPERPLLFVTGATHGATSVIETMMALVRREPFADALGPWQVLIMMQLTYLLLGTFLDDTAMLVIVAPLYVPLVIELGFDPIWYGVLYTITCQIAYMTPPFGYNLFLMKAMAPPEVTLIDIYRSIIPFVAVMIVGLVLVMVFPQIALWLPQTFYAR